MLYSIQKLKDIDILYGIREQDIERYAKLVQKTLKQESIKPFDLTDRTHDGTASREEAENDYLEATKVPYALDRDSDLSRYSRSYIYGEDGELQLVGYSKFEKEFIQETGIYPNINSENNNKNAKKEITFQDIGKGTIDSFKKNVENSDYNLDFVEQEINEQEQDKGKN